MDTRESRRTAVVYWILIFLGMLCAIALFRSFVVDIRTVEGISMEDTLHDGDRVLIRKFAVTDVDRYDIVLCRQGDTTLVKRVVGLPGDHIQMSKTGYLWINGEPAPDVYQIDADRQQMDPVDVTLEEDQYFVLGDNRLNSLDSRYYGPFSGEDLCGVYLCQIWPLPYVNRN